jgi:circadian clock protein KaiC
MRAQEQKARNNKASRLPELPKCPTGIRGLDEITNGGIPRGRPTLVCGGAGCGKTLLGMEFLVRGAIAIDHIYVERSLVEETGEYDLEALFVRLAHEVPPSPPKNVYPRKRKEAESDDVESSPAR